MDSELNCHHLVGFQLATAYGASKTVPLLCFANAVLNAHVPHCEICYGFSLGQQQQQNQKLVLGCRAGAVSLGDGWVTPLFHFKLKLRLITVLLASKTG